MADTASRTERLRRRLFSDFPFFAEKILRIKGKDGKIIPFVLNKAQLHLHKRIEEQKKRTGKVRIIGLKGRQQGFSTYVQGRYFWNVMRLKGYRAFILTHEQEATNNLFEMVDRFRLESPIEIEADTSNAKELVFADTDSGYKVGTAGNKAVGRSFTFQLFHGSEVAYWPNASAHKAGVVQTVPDLPGTEIILESTANGVGGAFHDDWKAAEHGEGDYEHVFIPWYWQPEYRRDPPPGFRRTKDEETLVKLYGLDNRQLAWRRAKIAELKPSDGGNPEDLFKQEYPCTAEEAFLFSGRMVFMPGLIQKARMECYRPKKRGEIGLTNGFFEERADGRMLVWDKVKPGKRYVIGADVAEGLEHGDFSSLDVLEMPGRYQVAHWRGHIDPDIFGVLLYRIGRMYNGALIGVERNNHGLTTLTKLKDLNYPNLYAQEDLEHRSDKETKKIGWLTTQKSKHKIIDQLAAELRDGDHGICCVETIQEMGTYIIDEEGRFGAKPGCFDDRVMSRAIAGEMARQDSVNTTTGISTASAHKVLDPVAGY